MTAAATASPSLPSKRTTPAPLPPSKRSKTSTKPLHYQRSSHLDIKPLGNLFFRPSNRLTRSAGLGDLAALPDELLLTHIFSALDGEDLVRSSGVSRAFFGWSSVEGIWKAVYISKAKGRLLEWHGSWRASYIATFLRPSSIPSHTPLPTHLITLPTLHSDVLFQPSLCASFDPRPLFDGSFVPSIPHIDGRDLTPQDLPLTPVILTHLMDNWSSIDSTSTHRWTLPSLSARFPTTLFRAEATLTTLPDYTTYHDACGLDESPLYLFESGLVEKTGEGGMGEDYEVPTCFREDLFEVMGSGRPDYRWLIVGPTRSGSTWHQDPNGTSAWNAVTVGAKAWVAFPPSVTPPGIFVSADQGEVECPLSLAEWFMAYYAEAKATYGTKGTDVGKRGQMLEGICRAGEIFFVPSGWWHIVVNLEPSIAVTQNFVSRRELPAVLRFMKDRPNQVSGFKLEQAEGGGVEGGLDECDETGSGVYEAFCEALGRERPDVILDLPVVVETMGMVEVEKGVWSTLKESEEVGGFSFGFFDAGSDNEEEVLL